MVDIDFEEQLNSIVFRDYIFDNTKMITFKINGILDIFNQLMLRR